MDAVMLVGGQGTRLRPLTMSAPKPMLPVAGVPVTAHMLARARDAGIGRVVLATSYRAEVFEEYFGDGSAHGLELEYVTETEPLGTGGAIRNVAGRLRGDADDPVVIFNGDILSGLDIQALIRRHREAEAAVTLHLTQVEDPRAFGVVPVDDDGRVTAFLEKTPDPPTNLINAGCYVFRRSVIDTIPTGRPVSVERETFPALLAAGTPVLGFPDSTYWLDLGTPAAFVQGSRDLVTGRMASSALPGPVGDCLVLSGAQVAPDAKVGGGATVGARARVGTGAEVDGAVIFDDAVVEAGATVRDSVIGRGAVIGAGVVLDGVVIGDGAVVERGNELRAGARVFPGAVLAAGAVRFSSDRT
ncbi:sugar phosphate nucleotidyltransferase [Frankia sp. AgB32]|uniref:sugar phosphate nucleotidyltransferase n=1 Tax=Frankia sp. AgB32 TaxID=631119 RepID=UPI00200DA9F2|nr:NDP-sugar synthase [Frankia sp. AgB32]MCK9893811.1 NDP-sugar synthase [Frankia sp. AgB32]